MPTYLLTWTTYGTWLPGDERGFVSHCRQPDGNFAIHNLPGEPYDGDDEALRERSRELRSGPAVLLTSEQANVCVSSFREVARTHVITLHAAAIMRNHVHLVVTGDESGSRLLNLFKGVSSRRLGQTFGKQPSGTWWTRHGSCRSLKDFRAGNAASNYVMNQPNALIVFDETSRPVHGAGAQVVIPPPEGGGSL